MTSDALGGHAFQKGRSRAHRRAQKPIGVPVRTFRMDATRWRRSEPVLVSDHKVLKAALRLMMLYQLQIDEIQNGQAVTNYTRCIDSVQVGSSATRFAVGSQLNLAGSHQNRAAGSCRLQWLAR